MYTLTDTFMDTVLPLFGGFVEKRLMHPENRKREKQ